MHKKKSHQKEMSCSTAGKAKGMHEEHGMKHKKEKKKKK
jgi:hypothetical protein